MIASYARIAVMDQHNHPARRWTDRHVVTRQHKITAALYFLFGIFWVLFGKGVG